MEKGGEGKEEKGRTGKEKKEEKKITEKSL
jgi:hypothetical protein